MIQQLSTRLNFFEVLQDPNQVLWYAVSTYQSDSHLTWLKTFKRSRLMIHNAWSMSGVLSKITLKVNKCTSVRSFFSAESVCCSCRVLFKAARCFSMPWGGSRFRAFFFSCQSLASLLPKQVFNDKSKCWKFFGDRVGPTQSYVKSCSHTNAGCRAFS